MDCSFSNPTRLHNHSPTQSLPLQCARTFCDGDRCTSTAAADDRKRMGNHNRGDKCTILENRNSLCDRQTSIKILITFSSTQKKEHAFPLVHIHLFVTSVAHYYKRENAARYTSSLFSARICQSRNEILFKGLMQRTRTFGTLP
jgi:hypothetical protein